MRQEPTVYTPTVWFDGEDGDRLALTVPKGWERYLPLFATAPELYEAVRSQEEELHGREYAHRCFRDLLAKARGEGPPPLPPAELTQ